MPGPGKVATHPESVVTGYNQSNILTNRRNRPNTSKMLPNSNVNKTPLHPHGVQAYPENHTELGTIDTSEPDLAMPPAMLAWH
jgi:hypothetical protein